MRGPIRIARVMVRHGALGLWDQVAASDRPSTLGRRIARMLEDLGPTFVKLGQLLATREDIVPTSVARELARLQDDASPVSARAVRAEIALALGAPVEELYAEFDDQPLAAGSIAQVHAARLRSGERVVVKVRRPGIEQIIAEDLQLIRGLVGALARRSPELARHEPVAFVEEFGRGLRAELDLEREARSLARMRRQLRSVAVVPRPFDALCAPAVLTMQRLDGVALARGGGPRVARAVVACFATQYLRLPAFHADPHAGNILLLPDGRLGLLDLGAVGELDLAARRALLRLSIAAARGDGDAMARALLVMVCAPADLDRDAYRAEVGALLSSVTRGPLAELRVSTLLGDVFALARRHRLRFRTAYFALFRSVMLVDGVLRRLDPALDPVIATRDHIVRSWWRPTWFLPALWMISLRAVAHVSRAFRRRPRRRQITAATATRPGTVGSDRADY